MANNLTPEEIQLGRFYRFIHERAEFLRKQAAAVVWASESIPTATAGRQQAQQAGRPGDSSTQGTGGQL